MKGVQEVFQGQRFKDYLKILSQLHSYSARNCILIFTQKPESTLVFGFEKWKSFGRYVKRGEKGIAIFAPYLIKKKIERKSGESSVTDEEIEPEKTFIKFKVTHVYDISQTDGKPLLSFCQELQGNINQFDKIFESLKNLSPYPICFEQMNGEKKGYCSFKPPKIAVKIGMSDEQTIKTLIHEMAHALLHKNLDKPRKQMEVEAESIAFIVSNYLGLDTSSYSFDYIAMWSKDMQLAELQTVLDNIQHEAASLINGLSKTLEEIQNSEFEKTEAIPNLNQKLTLATEKAHEKNQNKELTTNGKRLLQ